MIRGSGMAKTGMRSIQSTAHHNDLLQPWPLMRNGVFQCCLVEGSPRQADKTLSMMIPGNGMGTTGMNFFRSTARLRARMQLCSLILGEVQLSSTVAIRLIQKAKLPYILMMPGNGTAKIGNN